MCKYLDTLLIFILLSKLYSLYFFLIFFFIYLSSHAILLLPRSCPTTSEIHEVSKVKILKPLLLKLIKALYYKERKKKDFDL